jgi:nitroreductase
MNRPPTGRSDSGVMAVRCGCLLEVIKRRRTARTYSPAAVPDDAVRTVLEAARWAPSAANRQPWEFIVIDDDEIKRQLKALFIADGAAHDAKYEAVTTKQAELLAAPVLIAVCGDPAAKERFINANEIPEANREELFLMSMGAAIQNMLLAAASLGLATTWLVRLARVAGVRDLLAVPASLRLVSFVVLGQATEPPFDDGLRVPIDRKTHHQAFGRRRLESV